MARLRFFLLAAVVSVYADDVLPTKGGKIMDTSNKILDMIMTPAYIPDEEKHSMFWKKSAGDTIRSKLKIKQNTNKAQNGILFIGDGMSLATIMAARVYTGQSNRGPGEENTLDFESFPVTGLSRTYCLDAQVPDSACTATAYLSGVKTKYGVIGLNGNVTRSSCDSQRYERNWTPSIGQWALDQGLDVGLVTTTRVTHASPAGVYAHTSNRNWESDADIPEECRNRGCEDIAYQLIHGETGRRLKVILGGGRREFKPNVTSDGAERRKDGLDLIELWHEDKVQQNARHQYVTDRNEFMQIYNSDSLPEYLLGLFNDDHLDYNLKAQNQPTLEEMTNLAIRILSRNPKGFFLFVEGGKIDIAHHNSQPHLALDETAELAKAVRVAQKLTSPEDTLIIVTSDHAHTMTVAGYPSRGNDILGVVDTRNAMDGIPYTTISYANGKAASITAAGLRDDVSKSKDFNDRDLNYFYPSLVPLDSETHGGEDVAVFALGPWQHLFTASYEQNVIPYMMAYAMCLGEEKHDACYFNGKINSANSLGKDFLVIVRASNPTYLHN